MQVGDGNELDQNALPKMIKEFQSQWAGEQPEVYVMDAAFYTEKNLVECSQSMNWISRVPSTIKAVQELTQRLLPEQFSQSTIYEKYSFCDVCSEYAGVKQQWIVVESEERRDADLKSLSKLIEQSLTLKTKKLQTLYNKEFACEADALIAARDFDKTLKYHVLSEIKILIKPHYKRRGKPKSGDEVSFYTYHIQANLGENKIAIKTSQNQAGRFILATNLLD